MARLYWGALISTRLSMRNFTAIHIRNFCPLAFPSSMLLLNSKNIVFQKNGKSLSGINDNLFSIVLFLSSFHHIIIPNTNDIRHTPHSILLYIRRLQNSNNLTFADNFKISDVTAVMQYSEAQICFAKRHKKVLKTSLLHLTYWYTEG